MTGPRQLSLLEDDPAPVAPAPQPPLVHALVARLPAALSLGTASWAFPGWSGLVYAGQAPRRHLARAGLAAYAQHPLLTSVSLDRTRYALPDVATLSGYAAAVPAGFRFIVKLPSAITDARLRNGTRNRQWLDAVTLVRDVLPPLVTGLAGHVGAWLLQIPAVGVRAPELRDRLRDCLAALPRQPPVAVEVRGPAAQDAALPGLLEAAGAAWCYSVHPNMPPLPRQHAAFGGLDEPLRMVRWNLHAGLDYETARRRYQPFSQLRDPDPSTRAQVAGLVREGLARGRPVFVTANNKAEGSAPLTLLRLAEALG